ncbi:hypothetical protein [Vibrio neptunius]|uniref:hypothetical protein n=1 Tax=Vibrio neptunius TaxID=170651 RepID=UPI001C5C9288|nr:hypothetical protein [Vibrio neptunius]QXX07847.1 hypothetical protein KW548_07840 [Vibrio neptunius]
MGKVFLHVIVVLFSFQVMASTTSWKELIWITEEYPPWTYSDNGVASGIYVELLEAIWEK